MPRKAAIRAEAERLLALFTAAGATPVDEDILQPAETLLDLYGEDIRARAYVTADPLRGEQMLRPDFTVPVVQRHMAAGAGAARYCYAGEVFRRQEYDADRANEYQQVGYEVFDRADPAAADAEVFALMAEIVAPLGLRAATGDIGILMAAVQGLQTTDARKAALMRHIWRPRRFRALMDRFAGRVPLSSARQSLLAGQGPEVTAPHIGRRSLREIEARLAVLHADAEAAPISGDEVMLVNALLGVRETLPYALEQLRDLSVDLPAIATAVTRLSARADALAARGVDVAALPFEANYGRTSMEYYDGFVFGFYAEYRADLPPVVTGGRYDALTRRLGAGAEIPAVGGVLRPDLMLVLEAQS